jgi:hypothetical protein
MVPRIELSMDELREIAHFAAASAQEVLRTFEELQPGDARPREAIEAARSFASGGRRTQGLRVASFAAHRAARDADAPAAAEAARAAAHAAAAAYLHPLAEATQVKHILGASAHAARAIELRARDDHGAAASWVARASRSASSTVVEVLARYPDPPSGGGRVGELLRDLDGALRRRAG